MTKCKDIKWHFIGHIQRNKVNKLVSVPNLFLVETVDSEKLANALNTAVAKLKRDVALQVFVQINTSGEEGKIYVYFFCIKQLSFCYNMLVLKKKIIFIGREKWVFS